MNTKTLDWHQLRAIGKTDKAGRWYPCEEIAEYFAHIRSPSRAWPNSYAKAAMTQKFCRWLATNCPDIARRLGVLS